MRFRARNDDQNSNRRTSPAYCPYTTYSAHATPSAPQIDTVTATSRSNSCQQQLASPFFIHSSNSNVPSMHLNIATRILPARPLSIGNWH
ncbi:hypothetical protein J1614_010893 [Plenodomus biglobosus]|nr:hypothetical protein J1614_010893 [Plenodomus biglobosus]